MPHILITGAAGFIGSHLAEALLARGDTVTALDNFNDYYAPEIKRRNIAASRAHALFTLHEIDIRDAETTGHIIETAKPDVIVHLAARAGVRPSLDNPNLYNEVNVIGTQNILDAALRAKPSHLVIASSSSVYGALTEVPFVETMDVSKPISPYAATKRMNELMARVYHETYGLNVSMMRIFTAYGPRQRPDMAIQKFANLIEVGQPVPMYGDGTTRRDYTYIGDLIQGIVAAVDRPFGYEIFNLGESQTTPLKRLIEAIGEALNKQPLILGMPTQPGDVDVTFANIEKARRMLDYNPDTSIEEGLAHFVAWRAQNAPAVGQGTA
jgi:UDP-glucuronate 4-epimerase